MKPADPRHPNGKSGLLVLVLTTLFGDQYILQAAVALGRDRSTIRRWVRGVTPIPDYLWPRLVQALETRRRDVDRLISKVQRERATRHPGT